MAAKKKTAPKKTIKTAPETEAHVPAIVSKPTASIEPPAWPVLPSKLDIAERCLPLETRVSEIEKAAAAYLKIEDEATAAAALIYIDFMKKSEQSVEKRRKAYTDPARTFTETINGFVKAYTMRLEIARRALSQKLLAYQDALKKKADEEFAAKRKAEEADAAARAKKLEDAGHVTAAQQLREIAATAPAPKTDVKVRTESGISTAVVETWKGSITDMGAFLKAFLEGKFATYVFFDNITIEKTPLNKFAKDNKDKVDTVVNGVAIICERTLGARG